ncbi:TetR family transcriptional regulator [Camelimonas lactis]|nr:TetR family transcriptional regulator [Camelimonas lactis]
MFEEHQHVRRQRRKNGTAARPRRQPPADTRPRILDAAMECFAQRGFSGATTRAIAAEAGVTLPAIAYHFGNKEGLHHACARVILGRYQDRMSPVVTAARAAVRSGALTAAGARDILLEIMQGLIEAFMQEAGETHQSRFVSRELSDRGPAYEYLMKELWRPGVLLVADLLAIASGRDATTDRDKTAALMFLSSLTALSNQSAISLSILDRSRFTDSDRVIAGQLAGGMIDGLLEHG